MLRKECNGFVWFEFSSFQNLPVVHGCFSRLGGVSAPPFDSLNVGFFPEENQEAVSHNRTLVQEQLFGTSQGVLVDVDQVHGNEIVIVRSLDENRDKIEADAMITDLPHVGLLIKHADCQAALIVDPVHKVVANVHAGWRGSVKNIYQKVIGAMQEEWGSRPEDLHVGIGPSLGPQAFEFQEWKELLPSFFHQFMIAENHIDFWEASVAQLRQAGVLHIEVASLCTFSSPDLFFSFRRDRASSGRNATCIALRL